MQKFAPILALGLFLIVAIALVRNFIDARLHSDEQGQAFDPVSNFSKINSRGMVEVVTGRRDRER